MKRVKIALVGAGIIGEVHARVHAENPFVDFVAVVDIKENAARATADKYGCKAYTDLSECLSKEQIDAVDICVTEDYHVEPAVIAAKAGKHILIEKPIAKTVKEAVEIINTAEENGIRLMVGHFLKFDPRYAVLRDAIKNNELGEISNIFVRRNNRISTAQRLGGKVSFMYYLGVHDIEMMCDYAGSRPVKVFAQSSNKVCKQFNDIDALYAIVTFENGVVGCLEVDWSLPDTNPMLIWSYAKVVGTRAAGVIDIGHQGLTIFTKDNYYYPDTLHWPVYNDTCNGDMKEQINHFVTSLIHDKPFIVGLQTPVDAVRIIEACFESMNTGNAIIIKY